MVRDVNSAVLTAAASDSPTAVTFVKLEFGSGTLFANNSSVNISYGGDTYLGVGKLGAMNEVEESADTAASMMSLSLNGIDTTTLSAALTEDYRNRPATIYVAFLDASDAVIGVPAIVFRGRMDSMSVEVGDTTNITLQIVNRLVDWERTRNGRYTNEEQQKLYPGDKGLEFVVQAVEKEIYWGREDPQSNAVPTNVNEVS